MTGQEGLLGRIGTARTEIDGKGKIFIHGEYWDARAKERIAEGARVKVVGIEGLDARRRASGKRVLIAFSLNKKERLIMFGGLSAGTLAVLVIVAIFLLNWIKILNEYERGVVFRLGNLLPKPKGPGMVLVLSPIDRMVRVSLRLVALDVPPQDIITRDNVSVKVNAVVFFRVVEPIKAVVEVENFLYATSQFAQTTLRSVLGQAELDDLLAERDRLNLQLQDILDRRTDAWGIKVTSVEVKHVDLPTEMQRAIARSRRKRSGRNEPR